MVMTVRFRSFRALLSPRTRAARLTTAAVVLAILTGLVLAPGLTGIVVAYGYVLTAPLGVLTAPLRERLLGTDAVAPPRLRMPSVFLDLDEDEVDEVDEVLEVDGVAGVDRVAGMRGVDGADGVDGVHVVDAAPERRGADVARPAQDRPEGRDVEG
jgi:hypothetical protein